MVLAGWSQPASPTMRAGTPATVLQGGTVLQHHRARGDPAAMPDGDVAQHLGARADQHARADLGMPVAVLLAGAAQRHRMQHRDVVADHRGLADHDGMGMVDHDPLPDPCPGMDVDPEDLRGAHLEIVRHVLALVHPEPARDPMALQRLEALEEQDRLQVAVAGRVALVDRQDVGPRRDADARGPPRRPDRRSRAGSARSSPPRRASARCGSSAPARGWRGAGCPHGIDTRDVHAPLRHGILPTPAPPETLQGRPIRPGNQGRHGSKPHRAGTTAPPPRPRSPRAGRSPRRAPNRWRPRRSPAAAGSRR
jgi:hypothetical protein